ncbi:MAG TPA: branched-chain amino acid ABC transporter permease [Methylomirabilota bacterium]|jgi:branched-chain amino acid transport system permease protein|nr:branched-chain amino acid ABC transporter permease [Methylomirabilota bacterium]
MGFRVLLPLLAACLLFPLLLRNTIATEIWIFAILALAFNLLLGYTGLLSFGQATFSGIACYVAGLLLKHYGLSLPVVMVAGVLAGALSAGVVGAFCIQRVGLYFIMLTFAFNQMAYFIAYQWTDLTGGEDGLPGVPRPPGLEGGLAFYAFTAGCFLITVAFMKRITDSPFGLVLQAIRENEGRAAAVGYDVKRYKWLAFTIAGAVSGLGGVLYAMLFGIVPLAAVHWLRSGDIVFMTLIGGSGSLYGPIIGAAVYTVLAESVSRYWDRWPILLGLAFVVVVLFFRGGCVEAWERIATAGWRRRRSP